MRTIAQIILENTNKDTLAFIKLAHTGQKYGSKPYWTHPLEVANTGRKIFGSSFNSDDYAAALLHDVVEDTKYTIDDLAKMGYSNYVLDIVELVTKDKSLDYDGNIAKILSSGNKGAMRVKFADNFVNFSGDKSHWPTEKAAKSQEKYLKSMKRFAEKLGVNIEKIISKEV